MLMLRTGAQSVATEPSDRTLVPSPAAARAERDSWLADVAWPSTGMPARPQASTPCTTVAPARGLGNFLLGIQDFGAFAEVDWRARADVVELVMGM